MGRAATRAAPTTGGNSDLLCLFSRFVCLMVEMGYAGWQGGGVSKFAELRVSWEWGRPGRRPLCNAKEWLLGEKREELVRTRRWTRATERPR